MCLVMVETSILGSHLCFGLFSLCKSFQASNFVRQLREGRTMTLTKLRNGSHKVKHTIMLKDASEYNFAQ